MLAFVHDTKERGETRVRQAVLPPEEPVKGGKGGKRAAPARAKAKTGRGHSMAPEEEAAAAAAAAHQESGERALAEYQAAAREETARVTARLTLIRLRAVAELQALRQRAIAIFQLMWTAIGERYEREVEAAAHMADYLRSAVERQERIFYELLLDQDRFVVRTGVFTHLPCLPASPPPPAEALERDRFSLDQAAFLWRQLHTAAPGGTITTRAFSFILQDLVVCGVGTQELPELWMSLTQDEIESLSARLAYGLEVMSWRGLVYDLLEPWSRPDQYDMHEALAMAHVFDTERTGKITLEQALQVVHWMKPRLDEAEPAFNRAYYMKRLLVGLSGAPGDVAVDYQTLLLWMCRSDDLLQSFLCALTLLEDTPIFISNPEDDERYYPRGQVDLARIQSLPEQPAAKSPSPEFRPRRVRQTQSTPLLLPEPAKEEPATPKEVILKVTKSKMNEDRPSPRSSRPDSPSPGTRERCWSARPVRQPGLVSQQSQPRPVIGRQPSLAAQPDEPATARTAAATARR
ncbi:sperm flagellar protein 2-like [Pollicipes pollicipes]|uniref:sperm flagellar protein 2-like n=1 Tax=Pollicipes pollicipes TaxID=41117 RepID=UPI00188508A4|nr:sperm flagellar protein 2-like [Pollicipes pollicipes]